MTPAKDLPNTPQPVTTAAAFVVHFSHWRQHQADPPLSAGILRPIEYVDFYRSRNHPHTTDNVKQPHALGCTDGE